MRKFLYGTTRPAPLHTITTGATTRSGTLPLRRDPNTPRLGLVAGLGLNNGGALILQSQYLACNLIYGSHRSLDSHLEALLLRPRALKGGIQDHLEATSNVSLEKFGSRSNDPWSHDPLLVSLGKQWAVLAKISRLHAQAWPQPTCNYGTKAAMVALAAFSGSREVAPPS